MIYTFASHRLRSPRLLAVLLVAVLAMPFVSTGSGAASADEPDLAKTRLQDLLSKLKNSCNSPDSNLDAALPASLKTAEPLSPAEYAASKARDLSVDALRTVDAMLRFDPKIGDRLLAARGGVPVYREWAGSNMKPATAWPLSQLLAARIDVAMLSGNMAEVDLLIKELDHYRSGDAYAPDHKSHRFGNSKRLWDDNAWLGLDLLQAYEQSGDPKYLEKAKFIVNFMERGILPDGGILWEERADSPSLNTCANAPSLQYFLGLFRATGDKRYLADAKRIEPVLNDLLRRSDGLYSDNVRAEDRSKRDETIWSYNQGAAIGANLEMAATLSDPTEKRRYLGLARGTSDEILKKIAANPDWLWKQPPAFNAVFFRNLLKLDAFAPDPRIRATLSAYLARARSTARRAENGAYELGGVGVYGASDTSGIHLIDQAAFAQMFALQGMNRAQILILK